MDNEDRAKLFVALSYVIENRVKALEEKLYNYCSELETKALFTTLIPLCQTVGLHLEEVDGELCIHYEGNNYPIRGPQGERGQSGTPGLPGAVGLPGKKGNIGPRGEGVTKQERDLLDEAIKKAEEIKKVKIPRKLLKEKVVPQPGNVIAGNENNDDAKAEFDMKLHDMKKEMTEFRQTVNTEISRRMGMLAMMQTAGGGSGEVKLRRMDDVDMGDSADGGLVEWDATTGKFILSPHVRAQNLAPVAGELIIDYKNGATITINLDESITNFEINNWPEPGTTLGKVTLIIKQDGGGNTMVWPTGTIWPGGTEPTLTSTDGGIDIVVLTTTDQGTIIIGSLIGQNYS